MKCVMRPRDFLVVWVYIFFSHYFFFLNHTPTRRKSCGIQMKCIKRPRDFLVVGVCKFILILFFYLKKKSNTYQEKFLWCSNEMYQETTRFSLGVGGKIAIFEKNFIDSFLHLPLPRDNLVVSCFFYHKTTRFSCGVGM